MINTYELIASGFSTELVKHNNIITEAFYVIPDLVRDYHELEVRKEVFIKKMDCDTAERAEICSVIKELSRNGDLTDSRLSRLLDVWR